VNIFEFCERFHISLAKARKMNKAGVLRLDENTSEAITEIRHALSRGQPLTAAQLVELVESPSAVLDLGRYAARAQDELDALGDARAQAAPKQVAAYISEAARGDREAVAVLVEWLKDIIPAKPVTHSFIAVRLLLGLAPSVRKFDVPRIPRALHECRKSEAFADWFEVSYSGTRARTFYRKPAKKPVVNFDL
jgi:hypothetical protein